MSATALVLVETIGDYLPLLEDAGFNLIVAPTRKAAPMQCVNMPSRSLRC
jgi:hypothetical protein